MLTTAIALALLSSPSSVPAASQTGKKPSLPKQAMLDRFSFWDNKDWDWYKQNIPFWESPDKDIDETYYYRWELITKHRVYGSPETGYIYTEFINRPPWSGAYGAISCPVGFQLYELRWLKEKQTTLDYAKYWYSTPGAQPRSYSNWLVDSFWAIYQVHGDKDWILSMLPAMETHYKGWKDEHFIQEKGMFAWAGMHDGMETNIASRQTNDWFAGAESFRPTLNAYVYGDLIATAKAYALAGNSAKAAEFNRLARDLQQKMQAYLWDTKRNFFSCMFLNNESKDGITIAKDTLLYDDGKFKGSPYGRQLIGYVPWMFNMPEQGKGYEVAWKGVTDPQVFFAPHGLYTVERRDPLFFIAPTSCVWSGNNWPYAQAQTVQAMANVVLNYKQSEISKADYFKVFKNYTLTHRQDGKPYLAETSDPDTGRWTFDEPNKSEHYFHSSYNDLLITGLAGLRPTDDDTVEVHPLAPETWDYFMLDDVSYKGRKLTLVWDKTGKRYSTGQGLSIWVDDKLLANRKDLGLLKATLPKVKPVKKTPPAKPWVNVAVNNNSSYFPYLRVSSAGKTGSMGELYDGVSYYHADRPTNRWVSDSKGDVHTVEYDFGVKRTVEEVRLFVIDDGAASGIVAPKGFALEAFDGSQWKKIEKFKATPKTPTGHTCNSLRFAPVEALKLRVHLKAKPGTAVGLSELEAWGHNALPLPAAKSPNNLAQGAKVTASYTCRFDLLSEVNDGIIAMDGGRNRWTAFESPNSSDWIEFDFKAPTTIGSVSLCLYSDGGGVQLPTSYRLEQWSGGAWTPIKETGREPSVTTRKVPNRIFFAPITTQKLRVVFEHNPRAKSGASEILIFPPEAGE